MANRTCPFCKEKVKRDAVVCKYCQKELPPLPPPKKVPKWLAFAIIIIFLLIVINAMYTYPPPKQQDTPPQVKKTDDEHINDIEKRIRDYKEFMKTRYPTLEMYNTIKKDLIGVSLLEAVYKDDKTDKTYKRVKQIKPELELLLKKIYIKRLELAMFDKGFDVSVSMRGKNNETLVYRYVLMNNALAHKLVNEAKILDSLSDAGFKEVYFTNGYDFGVTYSIKK
ncbi:MAG: hypothetical protein N3A62_01555 [Thermodesulfovibrionales bacterium]|nr:hypothetical protein [Thermodesulfovibrionales bacterium]